MARALVVLGFLSFLVLGDNHVKIVCQHSCNPTKGPDLAVYRRCNKISYFTYFVRVSTALEFMYSMCCEQWKKIKKMF